MSDLDSAPIAMLFITESGHAAFGFRPDFDNTDGRKKIADFIRTAADELVTALNEPVDQ